jgi:hypothetical protein
VFAVLSSSRKRSKKNQRYGGGGEIVYVYIVGTQAFWRYFSIGCKLFSSFNCILLIRVIKAKDRIHSHASNDATQLARWRMSISKIFCTRVKVAVAFCARSFCVVSSRIHTCTVVHSRYSPRVLLVAEMFEAAREQLGAK